MTTPRTEGPPAAKAGFDPALRNLAIVVLLGAIMTILDTTIVNVAVNTLGREFKTSLTTIQWVLTGYTLALSMSIPLTSWAMARFGAKTMWLVSLLLFISGSVLCGAAWSVTSLILFRVMQGLGAGMIMPIGQTMLVGAAGPQRIGRVMSVIAVPAMLAPVLGPSLGGLIIDHMSWRWMFYVNVPFCAVALIAAIRMLPRDTARNTDTKLDVLGLVLLSPGLAAMVYGLAEAGNGGGLTSTKFLVGTIAGLLLVAAFVVHAARKGAAALIDVRLLRNRAFSTTNTALFIYVGALFGMMVLLPLYFQVVKHQTPLRSGLMVAPMGLGAMFAMPISGKLSDTRGARLLALIGLPIMMLGVLGYTQLQVDTSTPVLLGMLFVIGFGHGTLMPALMGGGYKTLAKTDVPSATTASNIIVRVGSSFGVAALAVILQKAIQHEIPGASGSLAAAAKAQVAQAAPLLTHAFRTSFWWALGIVGVSLIPILLIPRVAGTEQAEPTSLPEAPIEDTAPADA